MCLNRYLLFCCCYQSLLRKSINMYIWFTSGCFQLQHYVFQEFSSCKLVLQKFHLYTSMIHLLHLCSSFKRRYFILKSHISNYICLYILLFMNVMILIFMFAPYINSIKTLFIVPTDSHYYKIVEMLKQFKIIILALTCFGSRRNHHQGAVLCLAKTTIMVFLCSSV